MHRVTVRGTMRRGGVFGARRDADASYARRRRGEARGRRRASPRRAPRATTLWVVATTLLLAALACAARWTRRTRDDAMATTTTRTASRAFCARANPLVCAHGGDVVRGGVARANTRDALERSATRGARACVEIDVARTRDGALVAMHARDVWTFTRGRVADVGEVTLDELMVFNEDVEDAGQRALTFRDALRHVVGRGMAQITIDFKENPPLGGRGLAQAVLAVTRELGCDECLFWGKDDETVREAQRLGARRVGYTVANYSAAVRAAGMDVISQRRVRRAEAVAVQSEMVSSALVRGAARHKLKTHVWTVNDPERMRAVLAYGVDGVLTDNPRELYRVIAELRTQCDDRGGL